MSRYLCIKNYYVGPDRVFTAGKLYPSYEIVTVGALDKPWFYITDNHGEDHILTRELREHFHELLDLNVDEQEMETYRMPIPDKRLKLGISIVIASILTILALIFFG